MSQRTIARLTLSGLVSGMLLASALPATSQTQAATESPTRPHVEALASERMDGRQAGTEGARLAADYIAAELQRIGVRPLPGRPDMFVPFEFTAGTHDGGSSLTVAREGAAPEAFDTGSEVRALSFSENAEVSGPAIFAGYGLVVPESQNFGYDSYATLDVTDKIVIVFRYFPEDADMQTKATLARYSDLRYKAMAARQRGAKGIIVVTGPRSPNAGETIPMSFDTALAGSGIVAASVNAAAADAIFAAAPDNQSVEAVQQAFDSGNPHVAGFDIPGLTLTVRTVVERETRTGRNVVGYLPATTADAESSDKPWVALGAHYDHLGHGDGGNSLAGKDDAGGIHYGADDNASGTAAVLAAAEALAEAPRDRHVMFGFWSAEEIGLIGSAAFVKEPPVPMEDLAAYFNFDMVGRMEDNRLTLQAVGSSPGWRRIIEQANVLAGFDLALQDDPYQPTDVASFNQASVPSLAFFTGTHPDYHRPSDTADKINYEDLDRVVDFAVALVRRVGGLETPLTFAKVEQQTQMGGRAGVRVFTGTIPDYASDANGLLLGGVIGGGPAEQAGLQKGDVIVEIAGQSIANIYDYTFALELLKVGEPVKVVYMRGGERREAMLTPGARQ